MDVEICAWVQILCLFLKEKKVTIGLSLIVTVSLGYTQEVFHQLFIYFFNLILQVLPKYVCIAKNVNNTDKAKIAPGNSIPLS